MQYWKINSGSKITLHQVQALPHMNICTKIGQTNGITISKWHRKLCYSCLSRHI